MTDAIRTRPEPQDVNALHTQERHTRDLRLGFDSRTGEMVAEALSNGSQNLVHAGDAGDAVRFTPLSASKTFSLAASSTNSIG